LHAPTSVAIFLPHEGQIEFGFWGWIGESLETHFEGGGVGKDEVENKAAEFDWEAKERGWLL
jgi:hypothetical protein